MMTTTMATIKKHIEESKWVPKASRTKNKDGQLNVPIAIIDCCRDTSKLCHLRYHFDCALHCSHRCFFDIPIKFSFEAMFNIK